MPTERELLDAVASQPPNDGLLIIDGGGRGVIAERSAGEDGAMQMIVLGPIDAGAAPAIRPGADGAEGIETGELAWLSPQRRREVRRERNQVAHALKHRATKRPETDEAHGATSALHGAPEAGARPDAAEGGRETRTASEVRVI
ncbi:MAG TPA: hypothetical protein VHU86_01405 [Solirubrobacterales bacterium]|jgi:hypothetical protein|nr:hypothetical protein [Solirubrobacterales bacterium]